MSDEIKEEIKKEPSFFSYKGRPLVRKGKTIYYGDMRDEYVAMLQIKNTQSMDDLELAGDVTIQLMTTDPTVPPQDIIKKKSEKKGLYNALDIAAIWLSRENA